MSIKVIFGYSRIEMSLVTWSRSRCWFHRSRSHFYMIFFDIHSSSICVTIYNVTSWCHTCTCIWHCHCWLRNKSRFLVYKMTLRSLHCPQTSLLNVLPRSGLTSYEWRTLVARSTCVSAPNDSEEKQVHPLRVRRGLPSDGALGDCRPPSQSKCALIHVACVRLACW